MKRHDEWLLERLRDPAQEADAVGAVDDAVIVGERERQQLARRELARRLVVDRREAAARDAENGDLW